MYVHVCVVTACTAFADMRASVYINVHVRVRLCARAYMHTRVLALHARRASASVHLNEHRRRVGPPPIVATVCGAHDHIQPVMCDCDTTLTAPLPIIGRNQREHVIALRYMYHCKRIV